ncbi:hypothetical protein EWB00_008205 [Schistosoma japonicum]|uniref:Uncharacterized protein n=1 Tax=Schistosoma japonicum TaxID=6182 RepID=A0A4Z2CR30_SCHJA|nr:hypothetical protein EWB00_008205 [Schistosoma japonicum]
MKQRKHPHYPLRPPDNRHGVVLINKDMRINKVRIILNDLSKFLVDQWKKGMTDITESYVIKMLRDRLKMKLIDSNTNGSGFNGCICGQSGTDDNEANGQ